MLCLLHAFYWSISWGEDVEPHLGNVLTLFNAVLVSFIWSNKKRGLGNKSCFIFTATEPSQWFKKKKKCNSTFLCKNWVKSKWNPFVSRLNANKHDPTLHVVRLQRIPRSEAGLLESECKWKCISSIYVGQVLTPGTTSSGSGEAGLCFSVWTLSISASSFPTRQCEHLLLLLRELTNREWLCLRVYRAGNNPLAHQPLHYGCQWRWWHSLTAVLRTHIRT